MNIDSPVVNTAVATVAIADENSPAGFVLIEVQDFDPKIHKKYKPSAAKPATPDSQTPPPPAK